MQDSDKANLTSASGGEDLPPAPAKSEAAELLRLAREAGCIVKLEGNWATFRPPMPPHLLLRSMDLSDEIASLLRAEATL